MRTAVHRTLHVDALSPVKREKYVVVKYFV